MFKVIGLGVSAIGLGLMGAYMLYAEGMIAMQSSVKPERMSVKELIARGPEGNPNLALTDCLPCRDFVYEPKKQNQNQWAYVWIPVVPREARQLAAKQSLKPDEIKVLLCSANIRDLNQLRTKFTRSEMQALVVNRFSPINRSMRGVLQSNYPGIDLQKCIILQEGRLPKGRLAFYWMMVIPVMCFIGGTALFLYAWEQYKGRAPRMHGLELIDAFVG